MTRLARYASEPFWCYFPLGLLSSVVGVLLWPGFFHGWIPYYPLEAHSRFMVLGFGGCFITGFLGTAGPRLLGAHSWSRFELVVHFLMPLGMLVCLSLNRIATADLVAGLWLLGVLISLVLRVFLGRKDIPPPGLPLAALGLGGASVAGILLGISGHVSFSWPVLQFWRLVYFQGFLWLPILGVAPYLLPRFFGEKSLHSFDECVSVPVGWIRPFIESLIAGLLLIASFAIEARDGGRWGMVLRAVVVVAYLIRWVPGLTSWRRVNGLGLAVRWVIPCSAVGWLLASWFLPLRIGMLHVMFIGGIGLLILSAATRVILGHSEGTDRLATPLRWFHWVWGLLLFTVGTRLTSDFVAKVRITHFGYAAMMWVFVLMVWGWKIRRERRLAMREGTLIRSDVPENDSQG